MDEREEWIQNYIQQQIRGMVFGSEVEKQMVLQKAREQAEMYLQMHQGQSRGNPGNPRQKPYEVTDTQPPEVIDWLLENFPKEYPKRGGDLHKVRLQRTGTNTLKIQIADWPAYELFQSVWSHMHAVVYELKRDSYERLR